MTNIYHENKRLMNVVNEEDKVIGTKSRTEIHKHGLLHREIHVWMFDADNNIFFQKRGLHRPSAGLLDATIGGHVNEGEDFLEAAVRETKEEAGLSISSSDLVLLKKIKNISKVTRADLLGPVNNFLRSVYIYKNPISEKDLLKEAGIPGGGFKKLSFNILVNPDKEYATMFQKVVFSEELPLVLKFLK